MLKDREPVSNQGNGSGRVESSLRTFAAETMPVAPAVASAANLAAIVIERVKSAVFDVQAAPPVSKRQRVPQKPLAIPVEAKVVPHVIKTRLEHSLPRRNAVLPTRATLSPIFSQEILSAIGLPIIPVLSEAPAKPVKKEEEIPPVRKVEPIIRSAPYLPPRAISRQQMEAAAIKAQNDFIRTNGRIVQTPNGPYTTYTPPGSFPSPLGDRPPTIMGQSLQKRNPITGNVLPPLGGGWTPGGR